MSPGADPTEFMRDAPGGTLIYGFAADADDLQIEVLIRDESALVGAVAADPDLQIRAGCLIQDDIPVVTVLFRFGPGLPVYPSFWNFCHRGNPADDGNIFEHMARGDNELIIKFFGDSGMVEKVIGFRHPLGPFFDRMIRMMPEFPAWTMQEFRDAVGSIWHNHPEPGDLWKTIGPG